MKKKIRGFYLLVSSFVITLVNLPFAFAKSATGNKPYTPPTSLIKKTSSSAPFLATMKSVYDSLHLNLAGLSQQAYDYAKKGLSKLVEEGKLADGAVFARDHGVSPAREEIDSGVIARRVRHAVSRPLAACHEPATGSTDRLFSDG